MNDLLERTTCRIKCGVENGTGFFVNPNTILTARHVLKEYIDNEEKPEIFLLNYGDGKENISAKYLDHCDKGDVAVISIDSSFENSEFLQLCASEITEKEKIISYGYPLSFDGGLVGVPLSGDVLRRIGNSTDTIHDLSINLYPFKAGSYKGFSGAPVVDENGDVVSFIRFENLKDGYVSAVSTKKILSFLENSNIAVKEDQLTSFEDYKDSTFDGFGRIKPVCLSFSNKTLTNITPQKILEQRKGGVFYPIKHDPLTKLIADIKLNKDLKDCLWSGWLEVLTYIELLKGDYEDINHIQIEVNSEEIYKKFGIVPAAKKVVSKVNINFFFTENKDYFDISRAYIHECMLIGSVSKTTCNIFNSNSKYFGIENLEAEGIVLNISDTENSGYRLPNVRTGRLSLQNLREKIINSTDVKSAQLNLRQRIEDALK